MTSQEDLIRAAVGVDVIHEAEATYWKRRAEQFEWAKPRPGEYHGQATREELNAAWRRCHASAEACRQRAAVAETFVRPLTMRWGAAA